MRVAFDFDAVMDNRYCGLYTYGTGLFRGFSELADKPDAMLVYSKRYDAEAGRLKVNQRNDVVFRPMPVKRQWLEKIWRYSKLPSMPKALRRGQKINCLAES